MRFVVVEDNLSVKEIDINPDEVFNSDNILGTIQLDEKHDFWYPDDVKRKIIGYVNINGIDLPLPVYIAGFDGEETISAEIGVETVKSMIR
jgi:hypothetical protein